MPDAMTTPARTAALAAGGIDRGAFDAPVEVVALLKTTR
jgi:hypothetical protein